MTQTQDEQNVQTSVSSTQNVNVVNTDTENTNQQMSVDSQDFQLEGFNNIEAQPAQIYLSLNLLRRTKKSLRWKKEPSLLYTQFS